MTPSQCRGRSQWKQAEAEAALYNPVCVASCVGGKIQWIQAPLTLSCFIKPKLRSWNPNSQTLFQIFNLEIYRTEGRKYLL